MLIVLEWGAHAPVTGFVRFFFGFDDYEDVDLDDTGIIIVPTRGSWLPQHARVNFDGPYWTGAIKSFSSRHVYICQHGAGDIDWWRALVGSDPTNSTAGSGINIGVIDTPFKQAGSLSHVQCFDLEGREAHIPPPGDISHGQIVAELLGARASANGTQGVSPGADMVAIDVTYPHDVENIDCGRMAPAIETLSFDHHCDLINLSGGAARPDSEVAFERSTVQLRQAVEEAFDNGTLLIAAVGNDGLTECAIPACFPSVIGAG
ncbi:hypothetical protein AJ87_07025 [Rhizobium yanglingense]|nr:hypothetical protein AJ87_07025 [Rhizobium yanglingense]